jgi:membrane fusion protein (multidrug efflux system)
VNEHALLVPQQAVSRDPKGQAIAYVVTPTNEVELRRLTVDREVGHSWLVSAGVSAGDRVVVEGLQRIRPGAPVKAVPFTGGPPAGAPASGAASPGTAPAQGASPTPGAGK